MNIDQHRKEVWHPPAILSDIDDRFEVIFDLVHDGIFVVDPATGRFIEINTPGCAMFGYEKSELIGRDIALLSTGVPPYTLEAALDLYRTASVGETKTLEWRCKNKSGRLFWAEISIRYAMIGKVPVVIAIVRDISERKQDQDKLNAALAAAAAASESKSAFLANMSHELRTPLNAIIGFSELMLSQTMGPIKQQKYLEYLGDIRASGFHLLSLINDILDFSRLEAGRTVIAEQNVSLAQVIRQASRMLDELANRSNIKILIKMPDDLPHVLGDERRIKQIILNLMSNAIKFSHDSGTVTVTARSTSGGLSVEVCDHGIGIAENELPNVFERFRQVENRYARSYDGAGLGLPLVRQLIELHGGTVAIKSALNDGTTATIVFPNERRIALKSRS